MKGKLKPITQAPDEILIQFAEMACCWETSNKGNWRISTQCRLNMITAIIIESSECDPMSTITITAVGQVMFEDEWPTEKPDSAWVNPEAFYWIREQGYKF